MITTKLLIQIQVKMANEADEVLNPRPSKVFRAIIEEETVAEFEKLGLDARFVMIINWTKKITQHRQTGNAQSVMFFYV